MRKKQITMKEYMNIQIRFLLYVSQRSHIDQLSAAEMYAPRLAERIRRKYEVVYS